MPAPRPALVRITIHEPTTRRIPVVCMSLPTKSTRSGATRITSNRDRSDSVVREHPGTLYERSSEQLAGLDQRLDTVTSPLVVDQGSCNLWLAS